MMQADCLNCGWSWGMPRVFGVVRVKCPRCPAAITFTCSLKGDDIKIVSPEHAIPRITIRYGEDKILAPTIWDRRRSDPKSRMIRADGLAAIGQIIPPKEPPKKKRTPWGNSKAAAASFIYNLVPCLGCGAPKRVPCHTTKGKICRAHSSRNRAWRATANNYEPCDQCGASQGMPCKTDPCPGFLNRLVPFKPARP